MKSPISPETIKLIATIAMEDKKFASKIEPDILDDVLCQAMKVYILERNTEMEEKLAAFINENKVKK